MLFRQKEAQAVKAAFLTDGEGEVFRRVAVDAIETGGNRTSTATDGPLAAGHKNPVDWSNRILRDKNSRSMHRSGI